jgi:hypothetical protein
MGCEARRRHRRPLPYVPTRSEGLIHRSYRPGEIDAVAAYSPDTERCYLLPAELSVECAGVQLRVAPTKNNQAAGIRWAQDFEFAARIRQLLGR